MLFNSQNFILFFPIVATIYFILNPKWRIYFLLAASYYFYMSWKPEYVILLIVSTITDYTLAIQISKSTEIKYRKFLLIVSLIINFGILFSFKYFNFFSTNYHRLLGFFGTDSTTTYLDFLLPVGISFYTFQTVSYTIDVFRYKIKPERNFAKFALFVSFFPQLVAGPIERATNLLPQFNINQKFDINKISSGLKLIVWGFFQKIVIADNMALIVNRVYANPTYFFGWDIIMATLFFAVQIYCDFSGYTDIARGVARIMGIELMENFRNPYFARSIKEFWQRWHISLSSWFKDYLYVSLGGNRKGLLHTYLNGLITFVISGLWHGASWAFVAWGLLHGIYYSIEKIIEKLQIINNLQKQTNKKLLHDIPKITITFLFICFTWIFFRARSLTEALILIQNIFSKHLFYPKLSFGKNILILNTILVIILLLVFIIQRKHNLIDYISHKPFMVRWSIYYIICLLIISFGNWGINQFIYFQF